MKQTCGEIVANIMPSTGAWLGALTENYRPTEEFSIINVPYHACDYDWMVKYIKSSLRKQCKLIKLMSVDKYLKTFYFTEQLREYQNKIIDWTVNFNLSQPTTSNMTKKEIDAIFDQIYKSLIEELKMDEAMVAKNLDGIKQQVLKNNRTNKKKQSKIYKSIFTEGSHI